MDRLEVQDPSPEDSSDGAARKLGLFVISEETECFVWIPIGHGNIRPPPLRTRTTTRMNVNDRIRGRGAIAVAIFTERHFVSPAPSYASSPG